MSMDETRDNAMKSLLDSMKPREGGLGDLETVIRRAYRMRNDRDGNPRFRLVTDHGELTTAKGSQVGLFVSEMWRDMEAVLLMRDGDVIGITLMGEEKD